MFHTPLKHRDCLLQLGMHHQAGHLAPSPAPYLSLCCSQPATWLKMDSLRHTLQHGQTQEMLLQKCATAIASTCRKGERFMFPVTMVDHVKLQCLKTPRQVDILCLSVLFPRALCKRRINEPPCSDYRSGVPSQAKAIRGPCKWFFAVDSPKHRAPAATSRASRMLSFSFRTHCDQAATCNATALHLTSEPTFPFCFVFRSQCIKQGLLLGSGQARHSGQVN